MVESAVRRHRKSRQTNGEGSPHVPDLVQRAIQLIEREKTGPSLDELARACGVSRAKLTREFREHTGMSLVQYRNRQRVGRFLNVYAGGELNLTAAAFEAGFGSYAQFHRVCCSVTGRSPSQLIRAIALRAQ